MSEMIRRAGHALQIAWNEEGDKPNWLPPIEFSDDELRHLARAVIKAMQEPIQAMVESGALVHDHHAGKGTIGYLNAVRNVRQIWPAMIDEALGEGQ